MCHFITAVLPKTVALDELEGIARSHGRRLRPLSNPGIEAQLLADETYFITTIGPCDCGTPLGALARREACTPDWTAQGKRMLAKGWGRGKVARALAQKQADFHASTAEVSAVNQQGMSTLLAFITDVVESGKTASMGLLLHMYSGSLSDSFDLAGRETVLVHRLTPELLAHAKEDVLYVFTR